MLIVLVERDAPGDLLRDQVDLDVATESPDRFQHVPRDVADRAVRCQPHALRTAVAVFDQRLVGPQVEHHGQSTRAIGGRERRCLDPPCAQGQRRVLKLRLGWREGQRHLAQHLCMGVDGVRGRAPILIGEGRPVGGHSRTLAGGGITASTCDDYGHGLRPVPRAG
jgi:hypothetical protein